MTQRLSYLDFSAKIHEQSAQKDSVIKAQFEITNACNLRCRHCYTDCFNNPKDKKRELSTPEIKRILDEMSAYGILWLNLTGGEAMAHPDFKEIYQYAFAKGFILSLFSNGTVFTPPMIDFFKKYPPFMIDLSCHSASEYSFDWFTQIPGSFTRFQKGLSALQEAGIPFRLKTKLMNWNQDELKTIKSFVESFGMDFSYSTFLSPRLNGDNTPLQFRIDPQKLRDLDTEFQIYVEDEAQCNERKTWVGKPEDNRLYRCTCGYDAIHINAFGELGTCTMAYEARASLRETSLADAIHSVFHQVRSMKFTSDSPCATCEIFTFCERKPTLIRWETGDREKPLNYYCDIAVDKTERLTRIKPKHPLKEST